jgi:hypothetical protein
MLSAGPTLGRLPEGVSHERARCLRGLPARREPPNLQARSPELPVSYAERDSEPQLPAVEDSETPSRLPCSA